MESRGVEVPDVIREHWLRTRRGPRDIATLDERGAWVEDGRLKYHPKNDPTVRVISSETFIKNVGALSRYLAEGE